MIDISIYCALREDGGDEVPQPPVFFIKSTFLGGFQIKTIGHYLTIRHNHPLPDANPVFLSHREIIMIIIIVIIYYYLILLLLSSSSSKRGSFILHFLLFLLADSKMEKMSTDVQK